MLTFFRACDGGQIKCPREVCRVPGTIKNLNFPSSTCRCPVAEWEEALEHHTIYGVKEALLTCLSEGVLAKRTCLKLFGL